MKRIILIISLLFFIGCTIEVNELNDYDYIFDEKKPPKTIHIQNIKKIQFTRITNSMTTNNFIGAVKTQPIIKAVSSKKPIKLDYYIKNGVTYFYYKKSTDKFFSCKVRTGSTLYELNYTILYQNCIEHCNIILYTNGTSLYNYKQVFTNDNIISITYKGEWN